ncbi:MAG TPA: alkaline phosphatase [Saprospiraceae bacterium]|nr:alkaline phosphatase [Saprospiraceae bacterium]HPN68204.1 alkaline phosphatase [Saprospiraceae bacterium]
MRFKIIFSLLFIVATLNTGCKTQAKINTQNSAFTNADKTPKNIILMIGDGMGLTQITAAMISNGYKLNLERMPITGFHKSYSSDDLITDSAAGATSFACGVKTYNAAIGVTDDTLASQTILEEVQDAGMQTGVVVTSTIVHATPASFISHNRNRNNYEEIAEDIIDCKADYLIGGGKKYFDRRKDEKNILEEMKKNGYAVSTFLETDPENVVVTPGKKLFYLAADGDPLSVEQGRNYLEPMSMKVIHALSQSKDGFFLMIEGSQIDWGGHGNNIKQVVTETIDFDKTIGSVLDWVNKNGETLLIITADHETGGLAINPGTTMDSLVVSFATTHHSGTLIPVFSAGPGSTMFSGIYENTAIYHKMRHALNFPKRTQPKILNVSAKK